MFAYLTLCTRCFTSAFILPTIVTDSSYLVEQASEKITNPSTSFELSVREPTTRSTTSSFFHARKQRVQYIPYFFPFALELQNLKKGVYLVLSATVRCFYFRARAGGMKLFEDIFNAHLT